MKSSAYILKDKRNYTSHYIKFISFCMNRFVQKSHHILSDHSRVCMYYFIMFDYLFAQLELQDQGRGPNKKCVHTLDDLRNVLIEEWNNLLAETVHRYVNSLRRRLVACIDANGGHIPFWSDTVDCHIVTSPCVYYLRKWRALTGAFTSGRLNAMFTHFLFGPLTWYWRSNFANKWSNIMK